MASCHPRNAPDAPTTPYAPTCSNSAGAPGRRDMQDSNFPGLE
jgi:hypothetical protein